MTTTEDTACCAGTSMYSDCICPPEPSLDEPDATYDPMTAKRCAVCGGLNPGDITHTRC